MKKIVVLFILCFCFFNVFAFSFNTVALDNPAYKIIAVAQIKGIIPFQSDVKPYSVVVVTNLLNQIKNSGQLTESELYEVNSILSDFESFYSSEKENSLLSAVKNGYVKFGDRTNSLILGFDFSSKNILGYNFNDGSVIDSKNAFSVYMRGNAFDFLSYNVNAAVHLEKVNPNAYLSLDYPIDVSGNYFELPRNDVSSLNSSLGFLWGISANPEVNASFLDGKISARFASVKRDWGPSFNNLALSGSASTMSGLELSLKLFDWLEYTLIHSSLTKFALEDFNGLKWPSDTYAHDEFDNILSFHRLDLRFGNFKFALYENVVWRKRFELAYLNPFAIYMAVQNELSDYDNMMFGFDFSYTAKNLGKFYFAFALDEMSALSLKTFFVNARHIMAVQGGVVFPAKLGNFGSLIFQFTYVPAFFGTHYRQLDNPWGSTAYQTLYVNKGRPVSYPLYPDSLEFLINFSMGFARNYMLDLTIKDQMRSAQYAVKNSGTDFFTSMYYHKSDDYSVKKFFSNIWNNIFDLEINVTKKFEDFPLKVTAGLQFILDSKRDFDLSGALNQIPESERSEYEYGYYNLGNEIEFGDWNMPAISTLAKICFSLYY